jgi:hypothetical protein
MNNFKFCYPDGNNFKNIIKTKSVDEWQAEYVQLEHGIGYWIAESPFQGDGLEIFKGFVNSFPIQKDNNHPDNFDPNPFDTIHLPEWAVIDMCVLLKNFYYKHYGTEQVFDPQIHEWGNVYFKERSRPISCWRLPHIDYVHGMVANMWFTDHDIADSSTKLYHYTGKMHKDIYDFQVEEDHPLHKEWRALSEKPQRLDAWYNPPEEELRKWGFIYVGETPTKAGTVTMYPANIPHNPFVSERVDFRWSHAFAFSHDTPEDRRLGDIFL